jgi:hypothetical protein
MTRTFTLTLLLAFAVPGRAQQPGQDQGGLPENVTKASVLVVVPREARGKVSYTSGSATHLGNGLFLSVAHFDVPTETKARVIFPNRYAVTFVVVNRPSLGDLAALVSFDDRCAKEASVKLANASARENETIWKVGYPRARGRDLKRGAMLRSAEDHLSNLVRLDAAKGDSGGGVFDGQGKLIGVVSAADAEPGVSHVVPYERIKTFLDKHCAEWQSGK